MNGRWMPHVTVAAVIRDARRHHLLVEERPDGASVLNQPAGHLEPGERLLDAVVREVREETCHHFHPEALVGIYRWTSPAGVPFLRFCFIGDAVAIDDCARDPEILGLRRVPAETILSGELPLRSPLVAAAVRDAEAGARHSLTLLRHLDPVA